MHRRILSAAVSLVAFFALLGAHKTADPVFNQINSIVKSLSEISGLSEKHAVPYGRISKRQLRQFLSKRIKKTLKPAEIYADELALKMFGLVPQDFNLRKSTIDLLTEQAAAFYDYDEKKLFLLEDPSSSGNTTEAESTTLAHELSHALADQHFDLEKFMEETPSNDDENLAHTAVVEGQASWLMIAYDLKVAGQTPVPTPEMLNSVADSSETSMAEYPVLKGSPLYIQQSLLFPYTQGTLFFNAAYQKMGKEAFTAVFVDAPVDSGQIIHPERYFAHEKASKPKLPNLALTNSGREITNGSLGEFDIDILLRQYVGEAQSRALAPHLRGAQFKIFEAGRQRKPVLEYVSEWDTEERAANFFAWYEKILQTKWKHCDASAATDAMFAGTGDNGYFVARLAGNTVSSIEGLSDIGDWQRLKAPRVVQNALRVSFASGNRHLGLHCCVEKHP